MNDYSINHLIYNSHIRILTIHILTDNEKFIIAVNWYEQDERHFKMFKELNCDQVMNFSKSLKSGWNDKINHWLKSSKIPLKLKNQDFP
jgi:hypothetical protein